MRSFVNSVKTSKYIIGCTGATTYIYDLNEKLVTKFKDIPYGYTPNVSKCERFLCVKSTDRYLAFYNLETLTLVKKILLKDDQPQDDPATFDLEGNFINLQHMNGLISNLVFYEKETFNEIKRYNFEDKYVFSDLEIDGTSIKLKGFERTKDGNAYKNFVFKDGQLSFTDISDKEYHKTSNTWQNTLNQVLDEAKELNIDQSLIDMLNNFKKGK